SIIECGSVTVGGAKNAGIQNMHGEFCMFMSSDACFSSKDVCALIAEGFEAPIDSLWFKAEVIGNEKKALALSNTINSLPAGILKLSDKQMLATGQYIWHKAFRAVNFKIHNIAFPENECDEDVAFHFNWFSLFRNISVIDGCHLKYYINKNSVEEKTARKEEGMGVRYISSLDPIFQFWNKYDLLDRRKKYFTSLVSNFTQLAIKQSPAWEQCRCLNEITRLLRQWNIQHENVWLRNIQEGRLQIHIGDPLPDLQTMMVKTDELHTAVAGFSESQAQNTAHAESILQNVYQTQKVLAESLAQNSTDTQRALQDVQREQKELARIMKGTVLLARHSFFAIKIKRALYGMLEAVTVGRVKIKYSERKKRVDALLTDMKKARWFLRR
ncbi:MAG: hypothetical protein J5855_05410, partial [Mailhella sp.]|nr:hypothetical protein [Mailhella sp.]